MSRTDHSIQIKLRTYDAVKVFDYIKSHDCPCVLVKHTWSYRTRTECEPHVHVWFRARKPLGVETFNTQYIKKGLPDLDGRRGEYSTTDPGSFEGFVRYATMDTKGYKKKGMEFLGCHKLDTEQQSFLDDALAKVEDPFYTEIMAAPIVGATIVAPSASAPKVVRKTSLDKQIKFYEYCKEVYDAEPDRVIDPEQVGMLLADYFARVGFTTPSSCAPYVIFALLRLLNDRGESDRRDMYRKSFANKIAKSLFS